MIALIIASWIVALPFLLMVSDNGESNYDEDGNPYPSGDIL